MPSVAEEITRLPSPLRRLPFYYGWVTLIVAALAMVATLPGRTHGLGMITERLLEDLQIGRVPYASINLWATLLGALFCWPCGSLIDRFGARALLTSVVLALAIVVLLMSRLSHGLAVSVANALAGLPLRLDVDPATVILVLLGAALTLTRGLGQSALSVVSLAIVGKWFVRRLSMAMGYFSILVAIGFMAAFVLGNEVRMLSWQTVWAGMGLLLLIGMAPLGWLLVQNTPEQCGLSGDQEPSDKPTVAGRLEDYTLMRALQTPAFWLFGLATSVYGLVSSGLALFNESILRERGFGAEMYYHAAAVMTLAALISNFVGGWLGNRWSMGRVLGLALLVQTAALAALPHMYALYHVYLYALASGAAGGVVTVVFFAIWGHAFGRAHLGAIQGAAQTLTVISSALGPLLLAVSQEQYQSYGPMLYGLAGLSALCAVGVWCVPLPRQAPGEVPQVSPASSTSVG
ncbi:MAG TPA: MFS transporter [Gemmataceae bacterium]|nr:MFS transporter [Gemmataceae bacterium]